MVVVVPPVRRDDEPGHRLPAARRRRHPVDQGRPGEAPGRGVVRVVGVPALLTVPEAFALAAVPEVGVRVERVHDGRPVLLQQPDEDVDQGLVRIRTGLLQGGVVGDDGTQHQPPVLPEAGQPEAAAPGVHRGVEEDQLDPAGPGGEDVPLGPVAAAQGEHRSLPGGEPVEPEQLGVRLAQALLPGGGVRGMVGLRARGPGDLVEAVGIARAQVDADHRGPGVEGLTGVGVHQVQVVVGVGQHLHQPRPPAARYGQAGGRVRHRTAAPRSRYGTSGGGGGGGGREEEGAPGYPYPGQDRSIHHVAHPVRSRFPRSGRTAALSCALPGSVAGHRPVDPCPRGSRRGSGRKGCALGARARAPEPVGGAFVRVPAPPDARPRLSTRSHGVVFPTRLARPAPRMAH